MEKYSLLVGRDGGIETNGMCGLDKRVMRTTHRKGSLGYALQEEHPTITAQTTTPPPLDVVQFLSRSWSSTSLQAFQTISHSLERELDLKMEDDESEKTDVGDCRRKGASDNGNGGLMAWMQRLAQHLRQSWVDTIKTNHAMTWMREKLHSSKSEARKEELRFHAAMSVAAVAAAIAALSVKPALGSAPDKKNLAIAAAATLVAAQCAEAAELMGAHHQHVASVIRSAVSAATPTDILALTAAAATTLRGATRKRSRLGRAEGHQTPSSITNSFIELDFTRNKEILARGTELPTCINRGKTQLKIIHIYAKQSLVILRVRTKHLGGTFTTFKDYTMTEEASELMDGRDGMCYTNEVNGYCSIHIKTLQGDVHITFKDPEICRLWVATISQLRFLSKKDKSLELSCTSRFPCM